ncbi:MAG: hypothetical protein IT306_28515 [Chloroflexi bacterium]|nr:hypothetical protein [Chloroflexota bacterium]
MSGRPVLIALLLFAIVFAPPLLRWPMTYLPVHAEAGRESAADGLRARHDETVDLSGVAQSNENEKKDREERRGREDNQHEDNENDDWTPPPPPVRQSPPPPPPSSVQACLGNGDVLTLILDDGSVTVRAFQGGLSVELSKVDAGSVPPPPGGIVGDLAFRLAAASCGGSGLEQLPGAVNLGVGYRNRVGERVDEARLALMRFDGQNWTEAPGNAPDPNNNYVSASVTGLGVYAVAQR